jgi:hypothetical protein
MTREPPPPDFGNMLVVDVATGGSSGERGHASARYGARWFLGTYDWEGLADEVAEALRAYRPPPEVDLDDVRSQLEDAQVSGRTGLALLTWPTRNRSSVDLEAIAEANCSGRLWTVMQDGRSLLQVEHHNLDATLDHASGEEVTAHRSLSEIEVTMHGIGAEAQVVADVLVDLLESQAIEVRLVRVARWGVELMVPASEDVRAVALIDGLRRGLYRRRGC